MTNSLPSAPLSDPQPGPRLSVYNGLFLGDPSDITLTSSPPIRTQEADEAGAVDVAHCSPLLYYDDGEDECTRRANRIDSVLSTKGSTYWKLVDVLSDMVSHRYSSGSILDQSNVCALRRRKRTKSRRVSRLKASGDEAVVVSVHSIGSGPAEAISSNESSCSITNNDVAITPSKIGTSVGVFDAVYSAG